MFKELNKKITLNRAVLSVCVGVVLLAAGLLTGCPSPSSAITVGATLDGAPWSGQLNYTLAGTQTFSGASVPQTHNAVAGSYTAAYVSGGPPNATFTNITPSATQVLTPGGIAFTLNFKTSAKIIVNATLNGAPWSGPVSYDVKGLLNLDFFNNALANASSSLPPIPFFDPSFNPNNPGSYFANYTPPPAPPPPPPNNSFSLYPGSSVAHTFSVASGTIDGYLAAYGIDYHSGGPPGATLTSITPPMIVLAAGQTGTFTLNFVGKLIVNDKLSGFTFVEAPPRTFQKYVLPGSITVAATLDGAPWSGPATFTLNGPGGTTVSGGSVSPTPYTNMIPGNYTVAYNSGGPANASFVNIASSPAQALAPGGAITFTLNFQTKKVETGTIIVNALLGGSPTGWPVSFTITGPQTIPGTTAVSLPQTYTATAGSYTISGISGFPANATLQNITPSATQTLAAADTIIFTINFVPKSTINVIATLDGAPWSGLLNYSLTGPQTYPSSFVPSGVSGVMAVGTYTAAYVSGGPPNATFINITPSPLQTLTPGGTVTFTLNFEARRVETGRITVAATLDGAPWAGGLSYTLTGPQTLSGTSVSQVHTANVGSYTAAYVSGGPTNATFINTTLSPTQTLAPNGAITFTLNFESKAVSTVGTIIIQATMQNAAGTAPWTGPVNFTLSGPQTLSGTSVPQTFTNVPTGTYTLTHNSGFPPFATILFTTTPSATQTLTAGGTITITLNFR